MNASGTIDRAATSGEVLALIQKLINPLSTERVPLANACGRVLRQPVCAPEDQPPFSRSAVDGYAVQLDDPGTQFRIVDEIRAGDWKPRHLGEGETVRIATGGALPQQGLRVVMREDTRVAGAMVTMLRSNHETNVRFRGEDAQAGQILVETGSVLHPGTLALLASLGVAQPMATRLPHVLHIATGNEIVPPDKTPQTGQVRDSNSTLVRAFFAEMRIDIEQSRAGEDAEQVLSAMRSAPADLDLLLISGGASVGEHDFTRRLLEQSGFTIHVSKTAVRPGKPLIVAQREGTLAFGLPGNPLAHFVCLNLYIRAALNAFAGGSICDASLFHAGVLEADMRADTNARETFWPARWRFRDGIASLTPLRWASSGDLTSLATANALIRAVSRKEDLRCGDRVEFVCTQGTL